MIASCDGDFEQHPYVSVLGKELKTGPVDPIGEYALY
jgi:hypothetical protein